jgi:hypothetical protein
MDRALHIPFVVSVKPVWRWVFPEKPNLSTRWAGDADDSYRTSPWSCREGVYRGFIVPDQGGAIIAGLVGGQGPQCGLVGAMLANEGAATN